MNRNQAGFSPGEPEGKPAAQRLSASIVAEWFADPVAVAHYARAAVRVGLWRSEEAILQQVFTCDDSLLDVGCGAGRITLGLWRLGFRRLLGIDFCAPMIAEARALAREFGAPVRFEVADATQLPFGEGEFAGAVFGFNGLMQIPGRGARRRALQEIRRVVQPGGHLVFTTHDRELAAGKSGWEREKSRWAARNQDSRLLEFGDRILELPEGRVFMHLPDRDEVRSNLAATGWTHRFDELRSGLANEPPLVREFSDECRFWIATAGAAIPG